MTAFLLAIHVLAAVFWVGGMVFAHAILRPAAIGLDPAQRLPLWRSVLSRFFPWVGIAIIALLVSGFAMIFSAFGGFAATPVHVHIMTATGLVMMALFLHIVFAPWKRFKAAVAASDWPRAAAQLAKIRTFVGINIIVGAVTVLAGSTGRYW